MNCICFNHIVEWTEREWARKMKSHWTVKKHIVLSLFMMGVFVLVEEIVAKGSFLMLYYSLFTPHEAASIGVIGGVDGPTTVFIAHKMIKEPAFVKGILVLLMFSMYIPTKKLINGIMNKRMTD